MCTSSISGVPLHWLYRFEQKGSHSADHMRHTNRIAQKLNKHTTYSVVERKGFRFTIQHRHQSRDIGGGVLKTMMYRFRRFGSRLDCCSKCVLID
ncbi:hypothetical protein KIN20_020622 [Parelaphostrongylus tenuis]|uniref:Uncharacterized protein n=1 Tax=Parelaphostrongylus tenuis TaxID=148309 RepID=A0AAD5N4B9_PARTN|nr:hypothetical protein KIN20_020622 [Parelaphostrongylus tenuis]